MKNIAKKINTNPKTSYLLALLAIFFASCASNNGTDTPNETTTSIETKDDLFAITNAQFSSAKMELGKLEMHDFHQSVKAIGMVDVPPEYKASVSAYFGGYVKKINLLPGQQIRKGQLLFILENPDYIQTQQDFLEAKAQLAYLKSDFERQKELAKDNITSQKKYLKAEADYAITRVNYESLKKKLRLMNIDPTKLKEDNIQTSIAVVSPLSGYITSVRVTKGMFLSPSDVAISITNTEHLHLELNIFEKDLSAVSAGQPIKFNIQDDFDQKYEGKVYLVNHSIDAQKRTVVVHGHLINEPTSPPFVPGLYVEADIFTSTQSRLSLPQEAVVDIDQKHYVLIKKDTANDTLIFEKRQIEVGKSTDGYVEIQNHQKFDKETEFLIVGAFNLITE